jgi:hypothetical protein
MVGRLTIILAAIADGDSAAPVEMAPSGLVRLIIPLVGRRTMEGDLVRIAGCLEKA